MTKKEWECECGHREKFWDMDVFYDNDGKKACPLCNKRMEVKNG